MPDSRSAGFRLSHVGIAVQPGNELYRFLREVLALPEANVNDSDGAKITALAAGDTLLELLTPVTPDSPVDRFIKRRGPGIHHICIAVHDLEETLRRCSSAGIRLIDQTPRVGAEGKRIAFIHPNSTGGVLIELSES
jgi:methylmalonyl-CoA/ethylmalonyl-CoA epimerase